MPSPPARVSEGEAFLVERYLPSGSTDALGAAIDRVARLCAGPTRSSLGSSLGVQYLHSAYVPSEDTCFCLFRGPSSDAVRQINTEADFSLDRITHAVL